ncbi:MAG: protein-disulfide reductase DsbD domain-containing protein [Chitinophagaceae bacterium]
MKKIIALSTILFFTLASYAQIKDPVVWTYSAEKKGDKTYDIKFVAKFSSPWHLYSQSTPAGGPVPTSITFKTNPLLTKNGSIKEIGKMMKYHDQNFGVDVKYYSDQVVFVQTVTLKSNVKTNIAGTVEFMVCDDHQCLPPKKVPFDIKIQ